MKVIRHFSTGRHIRTLRQAASAAPDDIERAKASLISSGTDAIPELVELLRDTAARPVAMDVLAKMLTNETLPAFIGIIGTTENHLATELAKVLVAGKSYEPKRILAAAPFAASARRPLETVLVERAADLPFHELLSLIGDTAGDTRATLLRVLAAATNGTNVGEVFTLLSHSDAWVRSSAIKIIAACASPEQAAGVFTGLLDDREKTVRLATIRALGALKATSAIPQLTLLLKNADLEVQSATIDVLIDLKDVSAVPHLVEVLKDESEYARRAAVEVLNEVATADAIHDLLKALGDADWWVRVRAADALGSLGGERVVEAVLGLMTSPDEFMRRYAVEILVSVPSERAVDSLIEALRDPDWWVRERSIDALAKINSARAVDPLIDLMYAQPSVAYLCVRALSTIGDERAVEHLVIMLQSEDAEVHREAEAALQAMLKRDLTPTARELIRSHLVPTRVRGIDTASRAVNVRVPATDPGPISGASSLSRAPSGIGHAIRPKTPADPSSGSRSSQIEQPAPSSGSAPVGRSTPVVPTQRDVLSPEPSSPAIVNLHNLSPGTVLLDRYRIIRRMGAGGFGSVFLARDTAIEDDVVLKVLNPNISLDAAMVRRFVQELKVTRRITHPNVIRLFDFVELPGGHAISMEYFPGRDFGQLLKQEKFMPPARGLAFLADICEGLAAAHAQGIIHRDIKPPNVLVNDDNKIKLLDFGLASMVQGAGTQLTRSGTLIGTPHYMSPEQISGDEIDVRSDIYSLGVMMYEIFSGRRPFDAETPVKVLFQHLQTTPPPVTIGPDPAPREIVALVSRAMSRDRNDRPPTVEALLTEIRALLPRS